MEKLYAGFAAVDISGQAPIRYYGGISEGVHDPLRAHCTAISDGKETVLLISFDLKKMIDEVGETTWGIIEKEFGIPSKNVILSCTHCHSAPDAGAKSFGNLPWLKQYYEKIPIVVRAALMDQVEVTGAFAGKDEMEKGVTFVRRYLLPDGTYKMNAGRKDNVVCHESDADPEMRTLRLTRKGKKDLVLVNFQTHYGGATVMYPQLFSADFVTPFREAVEKERPDCICVYYSGAGGNINFISPIEGERKYPDFLKAIPAFAAACRRALAAEKPIALGPIASRDVVVDAIVRHDPPERLAQAKEVQKAGYDSDEGKELIRKYGFGNKYDASFTIIRASLPETFPVYLNAITFGDVAFVGAPYEMFDTSGKEIRDGSACSTTFVCSISGNHHGYVPSYEAYGHGAYETYACRFVRGEAERFVGEFVRMIGECREETK